MRKTVSAVFLTILLVCSSMAQTRKSEREHENLFGPVKTISAERARMAHKSGEWVAKRRDRDRVINYNVEGNKTKEIVYDGQAKSTRTYSYDADWNRNDSLYTENMPGRMIAGTRRTFGGAALHETASFTRWRFKFDDKGYRVEEHRNNFRVMAHIYDEKGNRKETWIYSGADLVISKFVRTFDERGNVTEEINYSGDGSFLTKMSFSYEFDSRGNWTERIRSKWEDRGDKSHFEPKEVTYRMITYYGDNEK